MPDSSVTSVHAIPRPVSQQDVRSIYDQLVDEAGRPVWRLAFGIAYDTGIDPKLVVDLMQSDPNIMVSNLQIAGQVAYTLTPEALAKLRG